MGSRSLECLSAACGLFAVYYNFVWRTRYPNESGHPAKKRPTQAMMAGATDRLGSFDDLYTEVICYG
jgi:hypothetical protein